MAIDLQKIKSDIGLGKTIFEAVPPRFRPGVGSSLLMTFDAVLTTPQEVITLYEIIDDPKRWKDAHAQFYKIREYLLHHKRFWPQEFLLLAENVAKVTYNQSGYPAPFDQDAGWYIPGLAVGTATSFKDSKLMDEVLRILTIHYTPANSDENHV